MENKIELWTPWEWKEMTRNILSEEPQGTTIMQSGGHYVCHQFNIRPIEKRQELAQCIVSAVNNTYGAGINPEVVPALLKTLEQIAAWPGNLDDDRLTSKTGPNDAAARGLMVVAMRSFAKAAIEKAQIK